MGKRKLFCEICPLTYWLSTEKEILKRHLSDFVQKVQFAQTQEEADLNELIYQHKSLIRRRLGNVNMELQENKAVNLSLAVKHIDGIVIRPGDTFSLWRLVGRTSARRGYREGLTITHGKPAQGIGGGLCQLSNLIHWMVLHSDLTIVEHHHHDGLDLFPDYGRQIPFGTGTSISYNYLDYRVKNNTPNTYQLRVRVEGEYLCGELRATHPQSHSYHIRIEDEHFQREGDAVYRNGKVFRDTYDKQNGKLLNSEMIRKNHARVMYDTTGLDIREG